MKFFFNEVIVEKGLILINISTVIIVEGVKFRNEQLSLIEGLKQKANYCR